MGSRIKIDLGRRSLNIMFPDVGINLKIFPRRFHVNSKKEYELLSMLSSKGIKVPKPITYIRTRNSSIVVREFVAGLHFDDVLSSYPIEKLKEVLVNLILELRRIEDLGIFVPEFSTLYKNVIVRDTEPYILDLERSVFSGKSIVTQFLGMLLRMSKKERMREKLRRILKIEKIKEVAKDYKNTRDIKEVLALFRENIDAEQTG